MQTHGLKSILRNKKGFTLMELIIVMTILAILVTLAMLYYGNFTNDARRTALLADLNMTDKALALYQSKYNEWPSIGVESDLKVEVAAAGTDVGVAGGLPAIFDQAGYVKVEAINRSEPNLLSYIKKTTFLFKPGLEAGDARGAGKLYVVSSTTNVASGTAAGGGNNAITLATVPADHLLKDAVVYITGGTGAGQSRKILDNTGAAATVDSNWGTNPVAASSTYVIKSPLNVGDVVFLQTTSVDSNKINDANGNIIYEY